MVIDDGLPQYFLTSSIDVPTSTILLPQRSVSAVTGVPISKNAISTGILYIMLSSCELTTALSWLCWELIRASMLAIACTRILQERNVMKPEYRGLCMVLFMGLTSLSSAETWHTDPVTGCTVYDDEDPDASVLISWSGDCDSKNRASGNGVLTWIEDGKLAGRYDGEMKAGKAAGNGVIYVAAEEGGYDRYDAAFKNNDIAGQTSAIGADGGTFEGTLNSADFSGEGILTSANGDQYTGEFQGGKMHGEGHLILANGEQYRGNFRNNEIEGGGEWLSTGGDYYKGDFSAGDFSGKGRYEAADGSVYEGEFANGLPEGEGRYTDVDGRVLAGLFKNGWPDGQVDITTVDGKSLAEFWTDGVKEEI